MSVKKSNLTTEQQKLIDGLSNNQPVIDAFPHSSSTTFVNITKEAVVTTTPQAGKNSKPLIITQTE